MTPISWLQTTDFNPSRWNQPKFEKWHHTIGDCWNILKRILWNQTRHTIPFVPGQYHVYGNNFFFSFWTFFLECYFRSKRPLSLLALPILHKWENLLLLCFVFQKWTYQRRTTDKNQEKITMCCLKCRHSSVTLYHESSNKSRNSISDKESPIMKANLGVA